MDKMDKYRIYTISCGLFTFTGKHRPDLETDNWHYYEKESGELCHFRKEHMVAVFGGHEPKKHDEARSFIKDSK